MDDAPAAHISPKGDSSVGPQNDVPLVISPSGGELCRCEIATRKQRASDDAHGFLRVITAMTQAIRCGGKQLELAKKLVNSTRRGVLEDPGNGDHKRESQDQTTQRRQDNKDQG